MGRFLVGACGWDVVDVAVVVPGAAAVAAGAAPIPNRAARFFNFSSIYIHFPHTKKQDYITGGDMSCVFYKKNTNIMK